MTAKTPPIEEPHSFQIQQLHLVIAVDGRKWEYRHKNGMAQVGQVGHHPQDEVTELGKAVLTMSIEELLKAVTQMKRQFEAGVPPVDGLAMFRAAGLEIE